MEELVKLVKEEISANNSTLKDKLNVIDAELSNVGMRLSRLYYVLETGKLGLNNLAPRIKEFKSRQNDLSKKRVLTEAEITAQGLNYLDDKSVTSYCSDLVNLFEQSEIPAEKALLRSFVKRIVIAKDRLPLNIRYQCRQKRNG